MSSCNKSYVSFQEAMPTRYADGIDLRVESARAPARSWRWEARVRCQDDVSVIFRTVRQA